MSILKKLKHYRYNLFNHPTGTMTIYRFKLNDSIVEEITSFAKIHQYDNRHDYKKFWGEWCETNTDIINEEVSRLTGNGYVGDVLDKMFKAGRYYFRKKQLNSVPEPKIRRAYISMSPIVIDAMDDHIKTHVNDDAFTPAQSYEWFCCEQSDILDIEIRRLIVDDSTITTKDVVSKFKKTYKNRYFIYTKH